MLVRIGILLFLVGSIAGVALAQSGPAPNSIPTTTLVMILSPWIGILIAYLGLRRNQVADLDGKIEKGSLAVFNHEMHERGRSFMDRKEQEATNKYTDKRIDDLSSLDRVCGEMGKVSSAIQNLAQEFARSKGDGKS